MAGGPNNELITLLRAADWRPEKLARKLNEQLAQRPGTKRRVGEKTPYGWLNRGEVPQGDLPELIVLLLADELGEPVQFDRVWPPGTRHCPLQLPANHGLDVPWTQQGMMEALHEVQVRDMALTRRGFAAISGAALTGPAWAAVDHEAPTVSAVVRGGKVPVEMVADIEQTVTRLQRLDDTHGGGDMLAYVGSQFDVVARILRQQSYTATIGRRLHVALAQIAQTAGFMGYDRGEHGQAQRYFLAGLHAAHTAGDRPLAANITHFMSNQAIARGKVNDALQLAGAAEEGAAKATVRVRALMATQLAAVHAASGDLSGFQHARGRVLELLNQAERQPEQDPSWAYWIDRPELDAIAGQSLVMLARRVPSRRGKLLTEAEPLLRPQALAADTNPYQRSALISGGWLSLAYARAGELDQAVTVGRLVLGRTSTVSVPRGTGLLRAVRTELGPHSGKNPKVREFVAALDRELPAA